VGCDNIRLRHPKQLQLKRTNFVLIGGLTDNFKIALRCQLHQVTSRPLTRMLMALAVPAIVLMKSPGFKTCPTNSGNV
jgi:hypothetical protein